MDGSSASTHGRRTMAGGVVGALALVLAAGCASEPETPARPVITARDFQARTGAGPATVAPTAAGTDLGTRLTMKSDALDAAANAAGAAPPAALPATTQREAAENLGDVKIVTGRPTAETPAGPVVVPPKTKEVTIDAMVGELNGKPVFVNEVLGPLSERLSRQALEAGMTDHEWLKKTWSLIYGVLMTRLNTELMVAEAKSQMTPQQKQGLLYFLSNIRQGLASQEGQGSAETTDERLQAETGKTLDQTAADRTNLNLIHSLLNKYVTPRVNVSWHDVVRRFNQTTVHEDPKAVLRIIIVPLKDDDRIAAVKKELASGKTFDEVAAADRAAHPGAEGGMLTASFKEPFETGTFVSSDAVNAAIRPLKVGGHTEGIADRKQGAMWWVKLVNIQQPPMPVLGDNQIAIEMRIRNERTAVEEERYLQRLKDAGTPAQLGDMVNELATIALQRYYYPTLYKHQMEEQEKAARGGPGGTFNTPGDTPGPAAPTK